MNKVLTLIGSFLGGFCGSLALQDLSNPKSYLFATVAGLAAAHLYNINSGKTTGGKITDA